MIKLKLIALYRVLTKRNFILLDNLIEPLNDKDTRKSRLLRRTDFSNESDFLFMKMGIMCNFDVVKIEEKHHSE